MSAGTDDHADPTEARENFSAGMSDEQPLQPDTVDMDSLLVTLEDIRVDDERGVC